MRLEKSISQINSIGPSDKPVLWSLGFVAERASQRIDEKLISALSIRASSISV